MRFIADYKVKVTAGKQLSLLIVNGINTVHHCGIGRKYTVRVVVILILAEIGHGKVGQQINKAALCLRDKSVSVGKEKNILHPALFQQHIAESHNCSCLARTCCHNKQRLTSVLVIESITYCLDSALLIVSACNVLIDHYIRKALTHFLEVEQLFKVTLGIDIRHLTLGIYIVSYPRFKAVCEEYHRTSAELLFKDIRIKLRLLTSF